MKIEVEYTEQEIKDIMEAFHKDAFSVIPKNMKWEINLRSWGGCTITTVPVEPANDEA